MIGVSSTSAPSIQHTALSDQAQSCPCILHGVYYLKDRDSRPYVWWRTGSCHGARWQPAPACRRPCVRANGSCTEGTARGCVGATKRRGVEVSMNRALAEHMNNNKRQTGPCGSTPSAKRGPHTLRHTVATCTIPNQVCAVTRVRWVVVTQMQPMVPRAECIMSH